MSERNEQEMSDAVADADDAMEALYEAPESDAAAVAADSDALEAAETSVDASALDIDLIKRVLETALLTSPEPLTLNEMKRMFPRGETNNELVRKLLDEIRVAWEGRGVELVNVASGWRFRSRPELQRYLDKLNPLKAPNVGDHCLPAAGNARRHRGYTRRGGYRKHHQITRSARLDRCDRPSRSAGPSGNLRNDQTVSG